VYKKKAGTVLCLPSSYIQGVSTTLTGQSFHTPILIDLLYVIYSLRIRFYFIEAQISRFIENYNRINSIKSPASGAGNVRERRLISQVGRVREVVCAYISVFLQSERWRCQDPSTYVVAAVMWLRKEARKVCETHAESCHAKWQGLCGCNPHILLLILILF
jgi:hypothetical protein